MINMYAGRFGSETLLPIETDHVDMVSRHYQYYLKQDLHQIDETTWNDLDMDVLYKRMNMTYSGAGDIMLYGMLRQPCLDESSLQKRYAIMQWAKKEEEEREDVIHVLSMAGKRYKDDLEQPFLECHVQVSSNLISYLIIFLFFVSVLLSIFFQGVFIVSAIVLAVIGCIRYWVLHKRIEDYVDSLVYMVQHMEVLHRLAKKDFTGLPEVKRELAELSGQVSLIRKNSSLSYFEDVAGWLNPLSQKESRLFNTYSTFMFEHSDLVKEAFAFVGMLDACISMASFSIYDEVLCDLQLEEKYCEIHADAMIHPLVKDCVSNTIDIKENRLLTGSNATGKSTYLKMVALNALLAQSFHFVYAKSYHAGYFKIATSMSIHDSIERNESTFVAEISSLKHLLDLNDQECPTLCVIDEILRGTNTLERIASSSAILRFFATKQGICLGATHDIELTTLLKDVYKNYHFSELMKDNRMIFDYKIHPGVTTTRNAITLLSLFGYETDIIEHARKRLQEFEHTGCWKSIA